MEALDNTTAEKEPNTASSDFILIWIALNSILFSFASVLPPNFLFQPKGNHGP
jgi:ABC-type multidrug transport system permease subunit